MFDCFLVGGEVGDGVLLVVLDALLYSPEVCGGGLDYLVYGPSESVVASFFFVAHPYHSVEAELVGGFGYDVGGDEYFVSGVEGWGEEA